MSERLARGAIIAGLEAIEKLPMADAQKVLTDIFIDVSNRLLRLNSIETKLNQFYRTHQ